MGQYQTFIVRIWTDGAASSTRGHIQHIASRRGKYFRDEDKMIRFIRDCLQPAVLPAIEPGDDGRAGRAPADADTAEADAP
ncbi:MAG TPA: hypothetical protein VNL16_14100 [Chloroflexota bacterium]|nr:hypothetical protein [Chloroflexota bacterium]